MSADWGEPAALLRCGNLRFDPSATLAVHCGNSVVRFEPYQTPLAFIDGQAAKDAEDAMKAQLARQFESLGGEFFLGRKADLASAFFSAAAPAAFRITATGRS